MFRTLIKSSQNQMIYSKNRLESSEWDLHNKKPA